MIVNLIGHATTREGLKIHAELDEEDYAKGVKISKSEYDAIRIIRDEFHGDWNYRIDPRDYQ